MCEFDPRADYVKSFDVQTTSGEYTVYGKKVTAAFAIEAIEAYGHTVLSCTPSKQRAEAGRGGYRSAYPHVWDQFPEMGG
ncbi:hypothetical protein [Mycobacteroides abscessus]|uniref:hypothetical protein n=1 Tax=Mycobacteroides abscessus TaxID=36809 RepID=UPI000C25B3F5|nr:hypothetical protein [Mycobacteroides abscessus]